MARAQQPAPPLQLFHLAHEPVAGSRQPVGREAFPAGQKAVGEPLESAGDRFRRFDQDLQFSETILGLAMLAPVLTGNSRSTIRRVKKWDK